MTAITLLNGLPFIALEIIYRGQVLRIDNALLDTGSYSTVLSTDAVAAIGLEPELTDTVREMFGVGGSEPVVEKQVDALTLAGATVSSFTIQLGAMDYGIPLNAIVGIDLLRAIRATIDLDTMQLKVVL